MSATRDRTALPHSTPALPRGIALRALEDLAESTLDERALRAWTECLAVTRLGGGRSRVVTETETERASGGYTVDVARQGPHLPGSTGREVVLQTSPAGHA